MKMKMRSSSRLLFLAAAALFIALIAAPNPSAAQRDPEEALRKCKDYCARGAPEAITYCMEQCEREYQGPQYNQQQEEGQGQQKQEEGQGQQQQPQQQEGEEVRENNPYVFEQRHFYAGLQSEHGRLWILPKFNNRSALFNGIENYRFTLLEAAPQSLVSPDHWDADGVLYVIEGQATLKLLRPDRRRSINLQAGDTLRVHAGTTVYMINRDSNQKIIVAKLLLPVFNPGHFQTFFGAGGNSFLKEFSDDILQSAFNANKEQLSNVFGQNTPVIQKASPEQIQSMSREERGRGGGFWPFGGKPEERPVNIFRQRPTFSNEFGELYEVTADVYREFQDFNMGVGFATIKPGAMMGPLYNTKSTKLAYIAGGEGYMEMIAPRDAVAESYGYQPRESEPSAPSYRKISSQLRAGMFVVVPAGYPFVAVASGNGNLQIMCYDAVAYDNAKMPLAGKRNVLDQMEDAAKELAFGVPVAEVNAVLKQQQYEMFFPGPQQRQQEQGGAAAAA